MICFVEYFYVYMSPRVNLQSDLLVAWPELELDAVYVGPLVCIHAFFDELAPVLLYEHVLEEPYLWLGLLVWRVYENLGIVPCS